MTPAAYGRGKETAMGNKTPSQLKVIVVWQATILESGVMLYIPHYIVLA
jgi:hypothetical protein